MLRRLMGSATCALLLSVAVGGVAPASAGGAAPAGGSGGSGDVGSPTVSGPVTGGGGLPIVFSGQPADRLTGRESFDLASVGYTQSEFFLDGTASAYSPATGSTLTSDGHWTVAAVVAGAPTRPGSW